jgi:ankyrin repeat protein
MDTRSKDLKRISSLLFDNMKITRTEEFVPDQLKAVGLIIKCFPEVLSWEDAEGFTALDYAARNGHREAVQLLLETKRCVVHHQTKCEETPLTLAAARGHLEIVQMLVETERCQIDHKTAEKETALSLATKHRHSKVVRALLKAKKGDVNEPLSDGTSLLMWATGDLETTEALLETKECKVDQARGPYRDGTLSGGSTALLNAVAHGNKATVQALIDAKANVDLPTDTGVTALMLAAHEGNKAIAQTLIDAKANVNLSTLIGGDTALMLAATGEEEAIVQALIDAKADVNMLNRYRCSALDYAIKAKRLSIITMLLNNHVIINSPRALLSFLKECPRHDPNLISCLTILCRQESLWREARMPSRLSEEHYQEAQDYLHEVTIFQNDHYLKGIKSITKQRAEERTPFPASGPLGIIGDYANLPFSKNEEVKKILSTIHEALKDPLWRSTVFCGLPTGVNKMLRIVDNPRYSGNPEEALIECQKIAHERLKARRSWTFFGRKNQDSQALYRYILSFTPAELCKKDIAPAPTLRKK